MSDETLRLLAEKAGIAPHWTDQAGAQRDVSPESLRAILASLGLPAGDDAALRNSLSMLEGGVGLAHTARFATARAGQVFALPLSGGAGTHAELTLENGEKHGLTSIESFDGALAFAGISEPGYHQIEVDGERFTVAVAPERCVTFADRTGGSGSWGLASQIYSLRTDLDGGIGSFAGIAELGRKAAALGADCLAISPVHALYGADPGRFSPYSPSTRLFLNPLHADPAALFPIDLVAQLAEKAGIFGAMALLSGLDLIDWKAATPLKQTLFRALHDALDADPGLEAQRHDFRTYAASASGLLQHHAVFEVLHATELARDSGAWHWRYWQDGYRDPESEAVAAFAAEHGREVEHQLFLQWLTARSYSAAQAACRQAGMRVGLIADLAIGMDGSGSHAWSRQDDILRGLSIGAPPDYYSAEGQSWGLTGFSPRGLAASGFAPFIETLRASLRHAGGIRIDHVMGMSRLWLVPEGASALDGAYVSYPSETLFRLIALESWRHGAVVIGEDLGTLPDGFRDYLREQGVAGMRVLRFEKAGDGYVPPQDWDAGAAAMTSTHDLIATAGWWAGSDLPLHDEAPEAEAARAWNRGTFWGALTDVGLVQGQRPAPDDTDPVVDAAIRYIAASPCTVKLLAVEDALGLRVQPNVPGTVDEKPNWRHRLDGDAGDLLDDDKVRSRLAHLGAARQS